MSAPRPPTPIGLRHVALHVLDLPSMERFYVDLLGFEVEWRPDARSVYLAGHGDSLALHVVNPDEHPRFTTRDGNRLAHIGLALHHRDDVDAWHRFLLKHGADIVAPPRTHRDGARSFYCRDPEGNVVQILHHPPIAAWENGSGTRSDTS